MKVIPLSQGKFAIVDDADFDWLSQWKWCARKIGKTWYALRTAREDGKQSTVFMHREIAAIIGKPQVDHWDRDGLNNTRGNLRPANRSEQQANSRKRPACTSRFKGVSWSRASRKWQSSISPGGKSIWLGVFDDELRAADAYNRAARQHYGEFAKLNDLDSGPRDSRGLLE